jgi:hypothetical protein
MVFVVQCVLSMRQKSATYDEWGFISSGIRLLRPSLPVATWDRFRLINPPLGRLPNALPVAFLDYRQAELPAAAQSEQDTTVSRDAMKLGRIKDEFPFAWHANPKALLFLARLPTVLQGVVLALLVAWWARRIGGPGADTGALLLFCFAPNILAHSRLATVDIAATLAFMGAAALAGHAVLRGGMVRLCVASLVLALALQTKLSAHLLVPALVLCAVVAWKTEGLAPARALGRVCFIAGTGLLLNGVLYGIALAPVAEGTSYGTQWGGDLAGWPRMAYRAYRSSLSLVETSKMKGFLVGRHYWNRHWAYYPLVAGVKTPVATLLMASIAMGLLARLGRKRSFWHWWTCIPPGLLVVATVSRGLNVGLRHILPAYPFMYAGAGAALAWLWRCRGGGRALSVAAGIACILPALTTYPHYLAFFNRACGGPSNGYRLTVDSNIDWGQDLPALAACQRRWDIPAVKLSYFGTDSPDVYGVRYVAPLEEEVYRAHPGWYAVSATNLQGLYSYPDLDRWAWLRARKPDYQAGYSILLFDVAEIDEEGFPQG